MPIKEIKQPEYVSSCLIFVIRLGPDNIVVTKLFSEYCNATLSVVHGLHTALFQCSSPLFLLGITKVLFLLLL